MSDATFEFRGQRPAGRRGGRALNHRSAIDLPRVRELLLQLNRVLMMSESEWHCDCPSCGAVGVLRVMLDARGRLHLKCTSPRRCRERRVCKVLGIGPEALAPEVLDTSILFTTHGRDSS